mgnify:CR=1 FL=1
MPPKAKPDTAAYQKLKKDIKEAPSTCFTGRRPICGTSTWGS